MNIVWKRPDGGVSVTHLTSEAESVDAEAQKLKARGDIPHDWELVAQNITLPPDREFREAWSWTTPTPNIDIPIEKAREVTRARLRREREPLLAALDLEYMRADEANNIHKKAEIRSAKQALRDCTLRPDVCNTLEELRAIKLT